MDMILSTKNSDYRVENNICTGVRSREGKTWLMKHPALGRKLLGCIKMGEHFAFLKEPALGMRLLFERDLVTSPVVQLLA